MFISGSMGEVFREKEDKKELRKEALVPVKLAAITYPVPTVFERLRSNLNCSSEGCFVGSVGAVKGGLALKIGENAQAVVARFNDESGAGAVASVRFPLDRLASVFSDFLGDIAKSPRSVAPKSAQQ